MKLLQIAYQFEWNSEENTYLLSDEWRKWKSIHLYWFANKKSSARECFVESLTICDYFIEFNIDKLILLLSYQSHQFRLFPFRLSSEKGVCKCSTESSKGQTKQKITPHFIETTRRIIYIYLFTVCGTYKRHTNKHGSLTVE